MEKERLVSIKPTMDAKKMSNTLDRALEAGQSVMLEDAG